MNQMTVVFAYGEWGCCGIEALQAAGYVIAHVYTHEDNPAERLWGRSVATLCQELGIACSTLDDSAIEMMCAQGVDYLFSFHYRDMLPVCLLEAARKGAYNQHPSLLPRYRGRAPVNWAVLRGEVETGVSLHEMVEKPDAGAIIAQKTLRIDPEEDAHALNQRLLALSKEMLAEVLPRLRRGEVQPRPMDISKGNYVGRRRPEDGRIDWQLAASDIYNLIRAVCWPWPGAFWDVEGARIYIWQARKHDAKGVAGEILSLSPLIIAAGEGAIEVVRGQIDTQENQSGAALAAALGWHIGKQISA